MRIPEQSDFGLPGVLNRHRRRHAPNTGDDSMRDPGGALSPSQSVVAEAAYDRRVERNMRLIAVAIVLTAGIIWATTALR
jgi:hypothetical protein